MDGLTGDLAFVGRKDSRGTGALFESHMAELAAVGVGCKLQRRTSDAVVVVSIEPGTRWIVKSTIVKLAGNFLAFKPGLAATG
jgi:hypothetical protein